LSFEFTTIARAVALRCLDRLAALGPGRGCESPASTRSSNPSTSIFAKAGRPYSITSRSRYGFDVALGESQSLQFGHPVGRDTMADYLVSLPADRDHHGRPDSPHHVACSPDAVGPSP
jgi:hypothetical protein